ncbi:hypothetical protein J437_LFUL000932 [Ladona fulva]|uniref:Transient receptor potential cation channel trpm n=1 Tax=Ladona fulva TaxID=123851 RepID=A0A8K0K6S1_LADFU|nr:hypothetical protein J437_LFUL000932 [Ladona fulva]
MALRLKPSSMSVGRVIYCVDIIYWYLRILHILGVNKYLGPLVTMMGKMIKNMIYFVVLLLVVLMSFGVCRQAILFPDSDPNWSLAKEVFFQPYFMLYGEVFADYIDPPCGNGPNQTPCQTGRWITPAVMSTYLLVANILLINLLIAVFNNIFNEVNAVSHQVWMFQRFTVVMEYEQKPVLPPPLILFCHIYLLLKFFRRKLKGMEETYDNGLKLFLDADDLERLHDFEEECVEGYFREKDMRLQLSTEERIKSTNERVENMLQKVEDIDQKENRQLESVQSLEYRLRNLENLAEKTSSHLAVIHRFMATHLGEGQGGPSGPAGDADGRRSPLEEQLRKPAEERHAPPVTLRHYRRPPTRSLTEVRPDWWPEGGMEHRHPRAPLLTASSIEEDMRKVETLVEGENEDEENDEIDARGPGSISGQKVAGSQHGTSKTSLHDGHWAGDSTEVQTGNGEERNMVVDMVIQDEIDEDNNLQSHTSLHLDVFECQGQQVQPGRDTSRRKSCDMEEEHPAGFPVMPGQRGGSRAAHGGFPRRQLSQTQSEPDMEEHRSLSGSVGHGVQGGAVAGAAGLGAHVTWAEPRIQVIPAPPRSMLLAMHAEYTSITDELETVCSLLSPPRTPRLLSPPRPHLNRKSDSMVIGTTSREHLSIPRSGSRTRHISEMSNPEMAIHIEKEHLRDAEECDYQMMEGVIQRRFARQRNEDNDGLDVVSSKEDDLTSSSDDASELRFVAPPSNQPHQSRARSYSAGVGSGSGSNSGGGIAFLTVTNEAPEYRYPPRLRRSSAVEMNENSEGLASTKQDSGDTDEFPFQILDNSSDNGHNGRAGQCSTITSQCPTIFCTDTDAEGSHMPPSRHSRSSINAVDDSTKSNLVTESSC